MTLAHILVFTTIGLISAPFLKGSRRNTLLLLMSILGVFWLQPATNIRNLDYWLPTATIFLAMLSWALTRSPEEELHTTDLRTLGVVSFLILLVGLTRYLPFLCCLTATRPPQSLPIVIVIVLLAGVSFLAAKSLPSRKLPIWIAFVSLIVIFLILKTEPFKIAASQLLRGFSGQDPSLASALDFSWLGFSYIAFRLLHTLRDRLTNRLPDISLSDYITYIVFFPTLTAGPIDRIERFAKDLMQDFSLSSPQLLAAGKRLGIGIFMKFAMADSLGLLSLTPTTVEQTQSSGWMWVLVYAYSLRIFFDFAGYTHIAIGIGMLFGIQLPENFNQPYLKPNLTSFWNSWHMTLTQWVRAYVFNPLTRALRKRKMKVAFIILIGQIVTMLLIGLWHGVTWNFVAWGLWHALGLFIHNRWVDINKKLTLVPETRLTNFAGVVGTFHFVTLGWVWFALPSPQSALNTWLILFGITG